MTSLLNTIDSLLLAAAIGGLVFADLVTLLYYFGRVTPVRGYLGPAAWRALPSYLGSPSRERAVPLALSIGSGIGVSMRLDCRSVAT